MVELLVVIAVIALLASLLLPALSKARDKALSIECTSNLHQLSLAMRIYVDQTTFYPFTYRFNDRQVSQVPWMQVLTEAGVLNQRDVQALWTRSAFRLGFSDWRCIRSVTIPSGKTCWCR